MKALLQPVALLATKDLVRGRGGEGEEREREGEREGEGERERRKGRRDLMGGTEVIGNI